MIAAQAAAGMDAGGKIKLLEALNMLLNYFDFESGAQALDINSVIEKIESDIDFVESGYIRVTIARSNPINYFLYVDDNKQYVIRKISDNDTMSIFYHANDKDEYINDIHNIFLIAAGLFVTNDESFYGKLTR